MTPGSRIGLVGDNGAGKTTLLRVINGDAEYDGGSLTMPKNRAVGFLPQDLVEIDDRPLMLYLKERAGLEKISAALAETEREMASLRENSAELRAALAEHDRLSRHWSAKGGFEFDAEAARVLKGLGFAPERDAARMTSEFSGGWKMRIALAALLLASPDVLLLDEPTNHLDTESMEWLENWLRDYRGTVIAVSHDRRFLEKMVTSVAELSHGKLHFYSCGYEKYLTERDERRERLEAEIERQKERAEEIQSFIERFRYKASKAAQVQSRVKMLEKMEIGELESLGKSVSFKFPEAPRSALNVITAENLTQRYGDNTVFSGISLTVQRDERVALVGVNGAGKSTLLRLLNKSEEPTEGEVKFGGGVKRAYFSQESAQNLDYSHTVWQEVCSCQSAMLEGAKRNLLGAFLFSGDDINKPVSVLSGGEKSRLGLLKMLLSESNLLILDEPTNHLDYDTKELFQRALKGYGGTVIIVSHDRAFLDELAGRVIEIRDGSLYNYQGNYSYFIEKRARQASEEDNSAPQNALKTACDAKDIKRREAEERNRIYRERMAVRKHLDPLEEEIERFEARKEEISAMLCDAEILADSARVRDLMIELKEVEKNLAEKYPRWEELAAQLEEID